ncbi:MAG: 50S ribosomal protein L22 [Oscillospiraceae bacterium]|jgi:large subunit ribosomal protein L22|nr:50S ribosomal protein L22 [Oscillospiraceae bacterium]
MESKAHLRYVRISPRKVTIVLDLIRCKPVKFAMAVLRHTPKAASEYLGKLLKSAVANAVNNHGMSESDLYISQCFVCSASTARRMRPVSKGRGHKILKRSSHITLMLKESVKGVSCGSKS